MAFREVRSHPKSIPRILNTPAEVASMPEDLFEPKTTTPSIPVARATPVREKAGFPSLRFSLPSLHIEKIPYKYAAYLAIRIAIALFLIWFGLTSTGSFYGPVSGKFGGDLAVWFYQYQLGTLLAMVGVVIGYDTVAFCW